MPETLTPSIKFLSKVNANTSIKNHNRFFFLITGEQIFFYSNMQNTVLVNLLSQCW